MKNPTQLKSPASVVTDAPASRAAGRRSSLPGFAFLRACAAGIALAALPVQAQTNKYPLPSKPTAAESYNAEVRVWGIVNPFPTPNPTGGWNVGGNLVVGYVDWGRLNISGAGYVTSVISSVGNAGGFGEVTVTGTKSAWISSGRLAVGDSGTGTLTISNGGAVFNTNGFVGYGSAGTGEVTVKGANSRWINSGQLVVGDNSSGILTLADGGLVAVSDGLGTLTLARSTTISPAPNLSTGTLNIGAYNLSAPTTGGGIVDASRVAFGSSTGVINFNQTGTVTFGVPISGPGRVVQRGTGVTLLTGYNTYTGETIVNGGTLRLGHNSALGTGAVQVNAGGFLDLNGRSIIVGDVTGEGVITNSASTASTLTITQTGVDILPQFTSTGGAVNLVKQGSGMLVFSRGSSQTGTITVAQGNLLVGNGGTGGNWGSASLVTLQQGTLVAFNRSNELSISAVITGVGSVQIANASTGTTTLKAVNTYTGATFITGGTLKLSNTGSIYKSGAIHVGGAGTFDVSAYTGGYPLKAGQQLTGSGQIKSTLIVESGAEFVPGYVGTPLSVAGDIYLKAGSSWFLYFDESTGQASKISFTGTGRKLVLQNGVEIFFAVPPGVNIIGTHQVLLNGKVEGVTSFSDNWYNYNFSHDGWLTVTAR